MTITSYFCQEPPTLPDRQQFPEEQSFCKSRTLSADTLKLGGSSEELPPTEPEETPKSPSVPPQQAEPGVPPSAGPSPAGSEPSQSVAPQVPAIGTPAAEGELVITSTSHKSQWLKLGRVVAGPRAAQFPEITRLFGSGSKSERQKVLRAFVLNGENLDAVEAGFRHSRTHSERLKTTRRLMTIADMQKEGFSECLASNSLDSYVLLYWYNH